MSPVRLTKQRKKPFQQRLRVRKTRVQNFLKDLLEFHVCDIRTGTNDNRIKLCFYFKFQRGGGEKNLMPE